MGDTEAMAPVVVQSLKVLMSSFNGVLFDMSDKNRPRLSRAGLLLVGFIEELRSRGLSLEQMDDGFGCFKVFVINSLLTVHSGLKSQE
ncbi:MAG: hypothetical protein GX565_14360 [Lentisphaerae bacterium]|nr:hypothetical protein [Lentisphaerota bacterium]